MNSTWLVALGAAIALTASCSSGSAVPVATAPRLMAPDTSGPLAPALADQPVTDVSGEWVVLREVTVDTGVFGSDQYAELRQWDITCVDAACTDIAVAASIQGQTPSEPASGSFDGEHLSLTTKTDYQCFVEATNSYSGPPVVKATEVNDLDVAVTDTEGRPTILSGTYTYQDTLDTTAEAAGCATTVSATVMSMVLVRSGQAVPAPLSRVAGIVRGGANLTNVAGPERPDTTGGPSELGSIEYPILPCQDDSCEYMIRVAGSAGAQDIALTGDTEAGYSGSVTSSADCVDAATGEISVPGGYATTTSVAVGVYEGAPDAIMLMQIILESTPQGEGLAFPDTCYTSTFTFAFGGRVVTDPQFYNNAGDLLTGDTPPVGPGNITAD